MKRIEVEQLRVPSPNDGPDEGEGRRRSLGVSSRGTLRGYTRATGWEGTVCESTEPLVDSLDWWDEPAQRRRRI